MRSSNGWILESIGSSHLLFITLHLMSSSYQGGLCSDALDVEWPCQGLIALHDKKDCLLWATQSEMINNLISVIWDALFYPSSLLCCVCICTILSYYITVTLSMPTTLFVFPIFLWLSVCGHVCSRDVVLYTKHTLICFKKYLRDSPFILSYHSEYNICLMGQHSMLILNMLRAPRGGQPQSIEGSQVTLTHFNLGHLIALHQAIPMEIILDNPCAKLILHISEMDFPKTSTSTWPQTA